MTIDFGVDAFVFDEEEKIILNHLAINVGKDVCCEQLSMGMAVCEDSDVVSVLQATYSKIRDLSVEEWDNLQSFLPFSVSVSDDDFDFTGLDDVLEN